MIPLTTEPILGWRLWHVREGGARLESWTHGGEWFPARALEARCRLHRAPGPSHRCGIYAFRKREQAEDLLRRCAPPKMAGCEPVALGSVSLWGRVVPHDHGWRAEFAYPYELFVYGGDAGVERALRERYAVDVASVALAA